MTTTTSRAGATQLGATAIDPGATDGPSPTDAWLATVPGMPALTGPAGVAERLLLLLHYGVEWDSWVGRRRQLWWSDVFPDRVIAATYRCATLRRWWPEVADEIMSTPRTRAQRVEVERLLRSDSQPVLEVLRFEVEPLLLRTRIVADAVREARTTTGSRARR